MQSYEVAVEEEGNPTLVDMHWEAARAQIEEGAEDWLHRWSTLISAVCYFSYD